MRRNVGEMSQGVRPMEMGQDISAAVSPKTQAVTGPEHEFGALPLRAC